MERRNCHAWAKEQGVSDKVAKFPDSSAHLTRRMGMPVDKDELRVGGRSWRHSMLDYLNETGAKAANVQP